MNRRKLKDMKGFHALKPLHVNFKLHIYLGKKKIIQIKEFSASTEWGISISRETVKQTT